MYLYSAYPSDVQLLRWGSLSATITQIINNHYHPPPHHLLGCQKGSREGEFAECMFDA